MSTNTTSVWRKKLKELEIVVVIPTYNNGKTLAAVIEEVCRYADDIIVVNDGSTDDTANILEQYPGKHSASCVFFSPLFLPTFVASL